MDRIAIKKLPAVRFWAILARLLFLLLTPGAVAQTLVNFATPFSTDVQIEWLHQVLPEAEVFGDKQGEPPAWPGYRTNSISRERELVGYAFLSADVPPEEPGYSAEIDMLIGVSTNHDMTGVKILDYEETYLRIKGDFLARPDLVEQFRNKPISDAYQIDQDFDGIAGSTVSVFAIARGARNAARRIAETYLNYDPLDPVQAARSARISERMREFSWEQMLSNGLVRQLQIPLADGQSFTLTFTYMGTPGLGDYWVGADNYALAERAASVYLRGNEIMLVAVSGEAADQFQSYQLQVNQDNNSALSWYRRFSEEDYVALNNLNTGMLSGQAQFAGAIILPDSVDITQPFSLGYRQLGTADRLTVEFQLVGLAMELAQGNDVLSETEIARILRAENSFLNRLINDPPWGVTPWTDVAALMLILAAAMTAFLRKSAQLRWITLALTVAYLGFFDGGFISVSHIVNTIKLGPNFLVSGLPLLLFASFTVVTTLLWGRIFCSSLCPFGAVQDFITRFGPKNWRRQVPQAIHDKALFLKYVILAMIVVTAFAAAQVSIFQYFEPFGTLFFLQGSLTLWVILIGILAACFVVPRFYCRYGCPLGAALGVVSMVSPLRIKRVPQCDVCIVCERACPTGAIRREKIDFKECVRCDICEIKLIDQAGSCRHSMDRIIASTKAIPAAGQFRPES